MNQNNNLYISSSIAKSLPSMVTTELSKQSAQIQQDFLEEYRRKKRSVGVAYLLFLFLYGSHYAYMGRWGWQILFWCTGGGILVWWLIDLFRLKGMIRNYNKDVSIDVMRNLKIISSEVTNTASAQAQQ